MPDTKSYGRFFIKLLLFLLVLSTGIFGIHGRADATSPNRINFQGKIVNADGTNVTGSCPTAYNFDFILYDDPSLGSPSDGIHDKWHELTKSVDVCNGVFQTELGSATTLPDFNTNTALYLAIRFNGDGAGYMTPRVHLDSVPYALNSDALNGKTASDFGQLAALNTWANTNTFQPSTNVTGLVVKQNSNGTPTADILNVQTQNATNVIQVTGPALNEAAVTITSVGATRNLTLDAGAAINIGNTNATSVSLCNSAACDTIDIGTNTDADTITIGDASSLDTVAIKSTGWSVSGAGVLNVLSCTGCGGGGTTLQTAYDAGNSIETAGNTPAVITETTTGVLTGDLLQLTYNQATGGTDTGDALQITLDAVDATAFSGNGLNVVIDQSQVTAGANAILVQDDAATTLFQVSQTGATTIGAAGAVTTALTITDTDFTNALSIGDNNIVGTTSAIDFTNYDVNTNGDVLSTFTALDGSTTTSSGKTTSTSLDLTSAASFDVGNYVKIDNTGGSNCSTGIVICYAKITAKNVNNLTISPSLTWNASKTVTEWHIPEVGGIDSAQTLTNRYGRGYFISGTVAGNASTYYSDGQIYTANADSENSGGLTFTTGDTTTSGNSGNISLDVGTAAGTKGTVSIGTTNASALSLGNGSGTFALASSGGLNVTTGGALTGVASIDTITTSATAITFAGTGTIASTTTGLSLDSGSNTLTIASSDTTLTASGITTLTLGTNTSINSAGTITLDATSTTIIPDADTFQSNDLTSTGALSLVSGAGTAININPGTTGGLNLATTNTGAVAIGNATGSFALTSSGGLNVTTGGALTGVASIDTITTSATAITFANAGTVASTGANALNLNSGTNGNVAIAPGGIGDLVVTSDADTNVQINYTSTTDDTLDITHINITDNANASAGALYGLAVVNNDNSTNTGVPDALAYLQNANAAETVSNGILVDQTGAGTLSNGIQVKRTAGAITTGVLFSGTGYTSYIDTPSSTFKVDGSGIVTAANITCSSTSCISTGEITDNTIDASDLAATITFTDGDLLNFASVNPSGTAEGLILPQNATACSAATANGQICWDNSAHSLYVGNGTTAQSIGGGAVTADSLDFTEFKDALTLDASTSIGFGNSNLGLTFNNDGSGDIIFNLNSDASGTGDFKIQTNGTTIFSVTDAGVVDIGNPAGSGPITLDTGGSGAVNITGAANSTWQTTSGTLAITGNGATSVTSTTGSLTLQAGSGTVSFGSSTILTNTGANLSLTSLGGSDVVVNSNVTLRPGTDGATAIVMQNAAGTSNLFAADTSNMQVTITGSALIGGASIGDDVFKDTTSDFTQSGYSVTTYGGGNTVDTASNQLKLNTNMIGVSGYSQAAQAAGPALLSSATAGNCDDTTPGYSPFTIQRPDKNFVVFCNDTTTTTSLRFIYGDGTSAWNNTTSSVLVTMSLGAGSTAFQRADGKFIVVRGGNSTSTAIYDPAGGTSGGTLAAGPATSAAAGAGALVLTRADGKKLLIHGNGVGTTSVYDPTANTFAAGSAVGGNVTTGSFSFQIPNGKWIVGIGGSTTTRTYDPSTTGSTGGTFTTGPTLSTATGAGAHVIQLPNGNFMVVVGGASAATSIYDVSAGTFSAGPSLNSGTVGAGAHSFQRSDGEWVVVVGGGSTNLQLYDPSANSFSTATAMGTAANTGASSFQRPDGKYITIFNNTTASVGTNTYDAGWNTTGNWTSEDINSTKLSSASSFIWSANQQSANNNSRLDQDPLVFSVKTATTQGGLAGASWVQIQDNGQLISTIASAAWAKIKADFNVPVRSYPTAATDNISQSNFWGGETSTFLRRSFIEPAIFSMRVRNPLVSYGDIGGVGDGALGLSIQQDGATLEGVTLDRAGRLSLQVNRNLPTSAAAGGFIIQSIAANLGATAGAGTHTMDLNNAKFLTIIGGTATTKLYDEATNTFSAGPALTATAGAGAHSFLMPDGQFFTVLGNASTTTNIYNPASNTFSAGPSLFTAAGAGANTFSRPDGLYVIVSGGAATGTNILDPRSLSMTTGPVTSVAVNSGGLNIKRPDGRVLVVHGGATVTSTSMYDPVNNSFVAGPVLSAGAGAGSTAVQLSTGMFWIKTSSTTATTVYNPNSSVPATDTPFIAGPATTLNAAAGDAVVPRPDGKFLFISGASSNIVDPANTAAAIVGPAPPCTLAAGSNVFQRSTGEYVVICGGGTSTFIMDAGWNLGGTYTSEQLNEPNLSADSSLYWKNDDGGTIHVKYRTSDTQIGLGLASWKQLPNSGSKISFTSGDDWFQTRIDFEGKLEDMPGAKSRVWLSESNGGQVTYFRQVHSPTLDYWQLANDSTPTVLTLKSGTDTLFRFSGDGQAFTSDGGAWNSGGADLAERYTSADTLDLADVVVGDKTNPQNVKRSTGPYQNIMGVVSTAPGFVAGAYTANSYPIALVGRVPVKVSTEAGPIRSGDPLTSSTISGYAMKATYAGRILGYALEDFDPVVNGNACPLEGAGNDALTQCGKVMVFVNLTDYQGQSVDTAMVDAQAVGQTTGISAGNGNQYQPPAILNLSGISIGVSDQQSNRLYDQEMDHSQKILGFLEQLKNSGQGSSSQIFTGQVSASDRVITPQIITDELIAKKIRADQIEGLSLVVDSISAHAKAATSLPLPDNSTPTTAPAGITMANGGIDFSKSPANFGDAQAVNLVVLAQIESKGGLVVDKDAQFNGKTIFALLAQFNGDAEFNGQVSFNNDHGGTAVVKKGDKKVSIIFSKDYPQTPIVVASWSFNDAKDAAGNVVDSAEAKQQRLLDGGYNYFVTNVTTKGFDIVLNKNATEDWTLNWLATSVKDAKVATDLPH